MPDCIIVGGGIIGLLTARALHEKGVEVLVLERGKLGGESSWAGGGIVSPLYPWRYDDAVNCLAERSKQIYPQLVPCLLDESGVDSELLTSGLFVLTDNEHEVISQWGQKWQVQVEAMTDLAAIREIEPQISDRVEQGVWMPDIMQVRNPKLVKALKGSFDALNIPYQQGCIVTDILLQDNRAYGVRTETETLHADQIIIASGAWSSRFVPTQTIMVEPVKGQMIMYRGTPGWLKRIVLSQGHYVIPRKDGRILAGSTLEQTGYDKSISDEALETLQQAAVSLIPGLDGLQIERQWAGLRPGTESGIPYICQHDEVEGLYVHAGHYRNGVVLGAASAELMAAIVLKETTELDISPYAINAQH